MASLLRVAVVLAMLAHASTNREDEEEQRAIRKLRTEGRADGSIDEGAKKTIDEGATKASPKKVEVLFVRHGHACHNAMNYQGSYKLFKAERKMKHCRYPDPPLTDCGRQNSINNGVELRTKLAEKEWAPAWVGSSSMVRAMETALFMFPDQPHIHPLPFISEEGHGPVLSPCNSPVSLEKQEAYFKTTAHRTEYDAAEGRSHRVGDAQLKADRIEWKHVKKDVHVGHDSRMVTAYNKYLKHGHQLAWTAEDARSAVKYKEFRAYLSLVVGELKDKAVKVKDNGADIDVLRLVVVSHSSFLKARVKTYFKCPSLTDSTKVDLNHGIYFENNGAMLLTYDLDDAGFELTEAMPATSTADAFGMTGFKCLLPLHKKDDAGKLAEKPPKCLWGKKKEALESVDYGRCVATAEGISAMGGVTNGLAGNIKNAAQGEGCLATACRADNDDGDVDGEEDDLEGDLSLTEAETLEGNLNEMLECLDGDDC